MTRTDTRTSRTRHRARTARAVGRVVYVLDAWEDTDQRSVVAVFSTRPKATRALTRLLARPGDWYAGVVRRRIQ
jgi:hypothetical protein